MIGIRVWTVLLLSLVFFFGSLLVLGLNRFGMGIEVRVRVLLFLFPVEDFYGFRVRPRVPRALPFLLLSLVFLSFASRIQPIWGSRVRVSVRFGSSHLFDSFLSFLFVPNHSLPFFVTS